MTTAIIWFRRDLRLADNPALDHACTHHHAVIPVYIDDDASHEQRYGEASRTWSVSYTHLTLPTKIV